MKTYCISIIFAVFSVFVHAQWTWQNPLPQGNSLSSIDFYDSNTGFAVGQLGTIVKQVMEGLHGLQHLY